MGGTPSPTSPTLNAKAAMHSIQAEVMRQMIKLAFVNFFLGDKWINGAVAVQVSTDTDCSSFSAGGAEGGLLRSLDIALCTLSVEGNTH